MKRELIAAIFDVDGLILDSEVFHAKAFTDAFNLNSPAKYQVDENFMKNWFYSNLSGKKISNQLTYVQKCFQHNDIPKIYQEYRKLFTKRLQTESVEVKQGFFNLIEYLKENGIKLAIVSTSSINSIKSLFKNSNIDINLFDVVISGDMELEHKPSPQPYLMACKNLNVSVNNAVVFEDSETGLSSAVNAGIKCFLIPGYAPISEEAKTKAFSVCNSLLDTIPILQKSFHIKSKN